MAQDKKVFADGAVIFREGDSGEDVFELISGAVDLLVKRDGKYAREQAIQSGSSFGGDSDTTSGIRLFTPFPHLSPYPPQLNLRPASLID